MALDIGSETHGDFRVLRLNGRLDTETSADFELAAHDLTTAGENKFIVDLSGISYVSSAGLRVLLALAKQMSNGGSLRLCGLAPSVRQVFDLSGFSKLFSIAPDLNAALAEGGVTAASPTPALSNAAADLLGATQAPSSPATPPAAGPQVGRQAADLLGAKAGPKPGLIARILAWFKGQ
jgi:anti-anti-sigma factor